eukprot:CAMPEP_0113503884 /NCGR_PEP_ID=MMETSP0014_2-20120614/34418_1 /TAXON_ID=2857 /ORGANISM="Nitzschia sp." /LENGTH=370 /DNA_ID=CAMNT_0000398953 /DNA_START=104 /DNA_END=1214 /DNA_ORIENTATION=+ /assembly_acc=CAM_ASM_000159
MFVTGTVGDVTTRLDDVLVAILERVWDRAGCGDVPIKYPNLRVVRYASSTFAFADGRNKDIVLCVVVRYGMDLTILEGCVPAEALPLRLVHRFVTPILLKFYKTVSDAVPQKLWQSWVVSKSETLLQAFVLIRVLSSERKDWIVNTLKESRSLIVPSITLFMPGFITQFGVAFVQYILPSAKSAQARGDPKRVLYLQYWIMHCMFSALLSIFSGVLWWVPFSTHVIFITWCYLALPDTIRIYYDIIESDLAAFGFLKVSGNVASDINDTTTAKLLSAVTSRLPSASSSDENDVTKTCRNTVTNDETTNNNSSNKNGDDSLPELEAKASTLTLSQDESDNEKSRTTKSAGHGGGDTFSATTGLEDNDVKSY